jgi:hypothetical protein
MIRAVTILSYPTIVIVVGASSLLTMRPTYSPVRQASHLLCKVHSERTLHRNFVGDGYKETLNHLLTALKVCKTKPRCHDSRS